MKFSKERRITRSSEFARVRNSGKSMSGRFLVMGCLKLSDPDASAKFGLITTRQLGNAVIRNRVRRRLRGILQRNGDSLSAGFWMVLVARKAAAHATSNQLEKEWNWMTRKMGLRNRSRPQIDSAS